MVAFTYRRPVPLEIAADEVVREVGTRPHLMLRVAIRGESFPHRALEPFARIDIGKRRVESLLTEVDDDERGIRGYFATDVPLRGTLTVGYGSEVTAVIPLEKVALRPTRLDESRIEGRFHRVTSRDPGAFRIQR
jgi:hypothetical protein